MKPFRFRLESLRSLRTSERDVCRTELTAAFAEQARVSAERDAIEQLLADQQAELRGAQVAGGVSLVVLRRAETFAAALRRDLAHWSVLVDSADAVVGRCREALAVAERDVEVLEKLREREHQRHSLEQARADSKRFDELAVQRFSRSEMPAAGPCRRVR